MRTGLLLFLLVGCGSEHPAMGLTSDADNGADVYTSTCVSCHSEDGTGGIGSDLTATVPNLSREDVITILVDGIPNTSMVSYESTLTDQEIADVTAYVLREWGS